MEEFRKIVHRNWTPFEQTQLFSAGRLGALEMLGDPEFSALWAASVTHTDEINWERNARVPIA